MKIIVTAGFHEAAVAALGPAARGNRAVKPRIVVRPQHDFAAVARFKRIGLDAGFGTEHSGAGVLHQRIGALVITTHQHHAATAASRGIHLRRVNQADAISQ